MSSSLRESFNPSVRFRRCSNSDFSPMIHLKMLVPGSMNTIPFRIQMVYLIHRSMVYHDDYFPPTDDYFSPIFFLSSAPITHLWRTASGFVGCSAAWNQFMPTKKNYTDYHCYVFNQKCNNRSYRYILKNVNCISCSGVNNVPSEVS